MDETSTRLASGLARFLIEGFSVGSELRKWSEQSRWTVRANVARLSVPNKITNETWGKSKPPPENDINVLCKSIQAAA